MGCIIPIRYNNSIIEVSDIVSVAKELALFMKIKIIQGIAKVVPKTVTTYLNNNKP